LWSWEECVEPCFEDDEECFCEEEEVGGFKDELVRAESGLSSSSSLESNTLGRFEEGADAAVLGDLEACTTAVCAARAFTLDKMDCKSGAAVVEGLTEAAPAPVVGVAEVEEGRVAGAGAAFGGAEIGVEEEESLGEGAGGAMAVTAWIPIDLSSSSSFWALALALADLGEATLSDLDDRDLSSSSSGGGFTLGALGEAAVGALFFEERGTSSSSLAADILTGASLGDVAFLGEVTWSPFMGKGVGFTLGGWGEA